MFMLNYQTKMQWRYDVGSMEAYVTFSGFFPPLLSFEMSVFLKLNIRQFNKQKFNFEMMSLFESKSTKSEKLYLSCDLQEAGYLLF